MMVGAQARKGEAERELRTASCTEKKCGFVPSRVIYNIPESATTPNIHIKHSTVTYHIQQSPTTSNNTLQLLIATCNIQQFPTTSNSHIKHPTITYNIQQSLTPKYIPHLLSFKQPWLQLTHLYSIITRW